MYGTAVGRRLAATAVASHRRPAMASPSSSSPSRSNRSGEDDDPETFWGWDSPTKAAAELDLDASLPHLRQVVLGIHADVPGRVVLFEDGATVTVQYPDRAYPGLSAPLPFASCDDALFAVNQAMSMKYNHVFHRIEMVSPYFAARELYVNPAILLLPRGWRRGAQRADAYEIAHEVSSREVVRIVTAAVPPPTRGASFGDCFPNVAAAARNNVSKYPRLAVVYDNGTGVLELTARGPETAREVVATHPTRGFESLDDFFAAAESLWPRALAEAERGAARALASEAEQDASRSERRRSTGESSPARSERRRVSIGGQSPARSEPSPPKREDPSPPARSEPSPAKRAGLGLLARAAKAGEAKALQRRADRRKSKQLKDITNSQ